MTDTTPPPAPESWAADESATGAPRKRWPWVLGAVVAVVLVVGIVAVVFGGAADVDREWAPEAGGRPAGLGTEGQTAAQVTPSADPGVYAWNSFDGWHVWVVNGEGVDGVSGTITADKDFDRAVLSAPGVGTVSGDGKKQITFDLPGDEALAGVDFQPGFYAKELTIDLDGPDGPIDPAVVTLGSATEVSELPIVVAKEKVSD